MRVQRPCWDQAMEGDSREALEKLTSKTQLIFSNFSNLPNPEPEALNMNTSPCTHQKPSKAPSRMKFEEVPMKPRPIDSISQNLQNNKPATPV